MRTIILSLILINLAFFYWARETSFSEGMLEHPRTVAGFAPIKMISEVKLRNQNSVNENTTSKDQLPETDSIGQSPIETQKCYSLGPFDELSKSDFAYEAFFGLGIQAKQRVVKERRPKSYWVYIPPYPSLNDAEEAVEYLKDNKVSEYYIWLDEPLKYAVSLGLFTNLKTARRKVTQIKKLNLSPEMEVRFNELTEHWVDFTHEGENTKPDILESLLKENDRLLILETKCL